MHINTFFKLLSSLIFFPHFWSKMLQVIYFDYAADGITYASLWDGPGLPFAGSLIMISVDILLYLFLAYYLDNVVPSMSTSSSPLIFVPFIVITLITVLAVHFKHGFCFSPVSSFSSSLSLFISGGVYNINSITFDKGLMSFPHHCYSYLPY